MGAQSPAASVYKPADQNFDKALHQATRPEPAPARQTRSEARPQTPAQNARGQRSADESQARAESSQPKPESELKTETQDRTQITAEEEATPPKAEAFAIDASAEEPEATAAETMAPFYMAALFDQSARYLQPPAQSERIAAAERVQEFVAGWLQTQRPENNLMNATAPGNQAESAEVINMALDILNQYVEETLGPVTATLEDTAAQAGEMSMAAPKNDQQPQTLKAQPSGHNAAELRQLMAVMMQSGRIPEPFSQQPENQDLQQQLDRILPLVISASSAAAQATPEKSAQAQVVHQAIPVVSQVSAEVRQIRSAGGERAQTHENSPQAPLALEPSDENSLSKPSTQQPLSGAPTDSKTGLQETQMAKIFSVASSQPQPDRKGAEPMLTTPFVAHAEESAPSDQPESSEIKFAIPQQQQNDAAMHMAANGPRAIQTAGLSDVAAVKMMQLPTGQQLPETQLVEQVVSHLAAGNNGETSRILLRLNPAELGTLRIELTMEGDKLRAQLHAQTQQVQEVLDRHLPQLRDALQMQGLKIDSFRVDVQGEHSQARDQASQWQQPQQQGHQGHQPAVTDWPPPELDIPLQQILQQPAGSISLRV
jgi:flagellar hook-length control protein FliK